jgi:ABC-type nitrate/sulfonate/bicarbonate transport system substrate-binding protein
MLALCALASQAAAQTDIRVGFPGNSLGFGAWFLAADGGIFARNGINAEFVFLAANAVPAALTTGGIQATPLTETVIDAAAHGFAVRDVALTQERSVYQLQARGDITTVQALKGKTIVASPPRALPAQLARYFLKEAGLDAGQDVKLLAVGSQASRMTMVLTGNGDAIIQSTTLALQLREQLPGVHVLKRETDMPMQLADGVATSVELIEKNPDLVRRMVRSVGQANAKARAEPDWAAELLAKRLKMPAHGKELASVLISAMPDRLTPTRAHYEAEAAFKAADGNDLLTAAQIESAWDTRFSIEIDRELAAQPGSKSAPSP